MGFVFPSNEEEIKNIFLSAGMKNNWSILVDFFSCRVPPFPDKRTSGMVYINPE
jgi:hypothetical protein